MGKSEGICLRKGRQWTPREILCEALNGRMGTTMEKEENTSEGQARYHVHALGKVI